MVKRNRKLRPFGILAVAIALVMLVAACSDGGDMEAISGLQSTVSGQSAEIGALSAQVAQLQTELGSAQQMEADELAELRADVEELSGQSMAPAPFDDSALQSEIGDIRMVVAELRDRMDEVDTDDQRIDISQLEGLDSQLMELGDSVAELKSSMAEDEGDAVEGLAMALSTLRSDLMALRDESEAMEIGDALERLAWLENVLAPAYTKSYVEEAIRKYNTQGRQATLDYYNTMESVNGDLYLFVLDASYRFIVHPTVPANIGMDIRGPLGTDITGKNYGAEFVGVDGAGRWVDYVYLNPANEFNYERKHSWIIRHEGLIFGSGWYEPVIATRDDPPSYTRALVERAIARYERDGHDATIAYYNSPESIDGQWYVFIGDENDVMLAHAAVPANVGLSYDEIISPADGYPAGEQVAAAAVEGGAWTTYTYLNASTGNVETKHSWVTRHNGMIFGSGWYEEGASKSDASAYTQSLVQRATNLYDDLGLEGTLEYYNSPESVDGQFYTFILQAEDLRTLANGARPELVDIDPPARIDAAGYAYGEAFAETTDEGHWVSYVFNNPATDELESKHTWIMEHDGLLFGSGWYTQPAQYTRFFVDEAIAQYESEGRDSTLEHYNSTDSVDGQWYVFIVDGTEIVGHYDPEIRGQDMKGPIGTDITGYQFADDLLSATEDGKWVSYVFNNPTTEALGSKHTWSVEHDGLIFASGWYTDPADYTQYLVGEAIDMYESQGREAAVSYYNTAESVDGQWYVFIVDAEDSFLSHAPSPSLLGTDLKAVVGSDGFELGKEIAGATEEGHWVEYLWPNPSTGAEEMKRSWVIRYDGLIFGSGYYGEPTG